MHPTNDQNSTTASPIDLSSLTMTEDGQPLMETEILNSIIDQYLDDAPRSIDTLRAHERQQEWAGVGQQAHALKGSSGHFGATALVSVCATIEKLCKDGRGAEAKPLIGPLVAEFARVKDALQSVRNKR